MDPTAQPTKCVFSAAGDRRASGRFLPMYVVVPPIPQSAAKYPFLHPKKATRAAGMRALQVHSHTRKGWDESRSWKSSTQRMWSRLGIGAWAKRSGQTRSPTVCTCVRRNPSETSANTLCVHYPTFANRLEKSINTGHTNY